MSTKQFIHSVRHLAALVVSGVAAVALMFMGFAMVEPLALKAQGESVDITITQMITGETSFSVDPTDVTMDNAIASISGGTSNGTSTFTVQSNSSSGYNVTLSFSDDPAMQSTSSSDTIPDYIQDAAEPDWSFGEETSGGSAQFGFGVVGATPSVVDGAFQDDGAGTCGGGGGSNTYPDSSQGCWSAPSTTALTILNRSDATTGLGDESSVLFRVHVPSNPSPAVPVGGYVATATLTVAEN
ncbi:MAG TPA: hypothetical protein VKP88_06655 [Candidatus Paceibacterota bacterium]|nr:hypothetical protein [Candidatus Paceibacterota bacterium]